MHQPSPSPQPSQKDNNPSFRTMSLPCLPLPLHRTFPFPQPLQNRIILKKHYILASLVKGEVLSPKKFGRLPEGLLPIRTNPPKTSPSLKNRHHPCLLMNVPFVLHPHHPLLCTITLASLVKGRWIDGKAQALILLRFACDTSTFLICQTFCRQDGGIASPPSLACTNPPKTALSPEKALYPFTTQPFLRILDISFYPCYTFISVSEN
mgnify:FL=1